MLSSVGMAQSPKFYLGLDGVFDNREYFTPYGYHQTIFGSRINPGVSFGFDSVHSVNVGISYLHEFGGELFGVLPQLDLSYTYKKDGVQLRFGSFLRRDVMDYPLILITDTLTYYRPNMEGASVSYNWDWGSVHGWVDWMGRETTETREAILGGLDASFEKGVFYLNILATRYHLAKTTDSADANTLRDDGSLVAMVGAKLGPKLILDKLDISTGWVEAYLYDRPTPYTWTGGWYSQLDAAYGIFGLKGTYYYGDALPLAFGDPLYKSGNYGRIDLFIDPFKNPRITSKIGWNLHFIPGDGLYHSQQILISIRL